MVLPPLSLLPVPCGLGGPDPGPALAPAVLESLGLQERLERLGWSVRRETALLTPEGSRWTALGRLLAALADRVGAEVAAGYRPLILGGDHAIAAGTWRGVARAWADRGDVGLIWIDAHLDAHTPADSPSGNPHGMPLAALLGRGAAEMRDVPGPWLKPERVALVGARSWEGPEPDYLESCGVQVFAMEEIRRRGLAAVLADAREIATAGGSGAYGVSLDVDALDPRAAPGVGTPEPDGLDPRETQNALAGWLADPRLVAWEISEYNPIHDPDRHTGELVLALLEAVARPGDGTERSPRWWDDRGAAVFGG